METGGPEDIRALNPAVSPALKAVVEKALAFDPAARYASAAEFSAALAAACGVARQAAPPPAPNDKTEISPPSRSSAASSPGHRAMPATGPPATAYQSSAIRKLAAILAADVAGYSRMMSLDEEDTLERLKAYRRRLIDPSISEHRGRIVKTTGDGLLAEFSSAVDAVRCAVELQNGLAGLNAPVPPNRRIEFRIGINVGDVIADEGDLYGDGVNVAARLEALAEPGGVLVSGSVRDYVQGRLPCDFQDRGEQQVKNIPRPVHVYQVTPPRGTSGQPKSVAPDGPSIAVLPFHNLSGDAVMFSWTASSRRSSPRSRASRRSTCRLGIRVFATRAGRSTCGKVAREFGARDVLEGGVLVAGNRLRVSGQLIDALAGLQLWADRFDGGLDEGFEFQDRVARAILAAIGARFPPGAGRNWRGQGSNPYHGYSASAVPRSPPNRSDNAAGSGKPRRAGRRMLLSGIGAVALAIAVLAQGLSLPGALNPPSPVDAALQKIPPPRSRPGFGRPRRSLRSKPKHPAPPSSPQRADNRPPPPSPAEDKTPIRDALLAQSCRGCSRNPSAAPGEEAAQLAAPARPRCIRRRPPHRNTPACSAPPPAPAPRAPKPRRWRAARQAPTAHPGAARGRRARRSRFHPTARGGPGHAARPRRLASSIRAQIPGPPRSAIRERSDALSYRTASRPKAAVFHPNGGRVFIVTGAVSQYAAEEQALRVCNTDRPSYGTSGPCFLYASGDAVGLPKRLIVSLAPAPVAPPRVERAGGGAVRPGKHSLCQKQRRRAPVRSF